MKALILSLAILAIGCANQDGTSHSIESENLPAMAYAKAIEVQGQYPAQRSVVLLRMIRSSLPVGHHCGGVLIGKNTVLTAAHCLENLGKVGNTNVEILFDFVSSDLAYRVPAAQIAIHPQYNQGGYPFTYRFSQTGVEVTVTHQRRFDFALLKFNGDIPKGFKPAAIAEDPLADLSGEKIIAYGAGARGNMSDAKSNVEVLNMASGKLSRGQFIVQNRVYSGEDFYMIEGVNRERICGGDSGGPQFLLSAAVPTVVGINSARFSEAALADKEQCGPASLAAKVSSAAKWILETKEKFETN